jgi:hypothetical protein
MMEAVPFRVWSTHLTTMGSSVASSTGFDPGHTYDDLRALGLRDTPLGI